MGDRVVAKCIASPNRHIRRSGLLPHHCFHLSFCQLSIVSPQSQVSTVTSRQRISAASWRPRVSGKRQARDDYRTVAYGNHIGHCDVWSVLCKVAARDEDEFSLIVM